MISNKTESKQNLIQISLIQLEKDVADEISSYFSKTGTALNLNFTTEARYNTITIHPNLQAFDFLTGYILGEAVRQRWRRRRGSQSKDRNTAQCLTRSSFRSR
ncbi:hypothetical protein H9L39_12673 [Fusarium oxysporum f. sp. albedinis]|nr:hypothetical protein H9L39_12673 [Fusarium oxysporum f. sp. albedinis]